MAKKSIEAETLLTPDVLKKQLESFFTPWLLQKWHELKNGFSFLLNINDSVNTNVLNEIKEIYTTIFILNSNETEIKINIDDLNTWANSSKPVILLFNKKGKLGFLLFTDHYLNILFSENPSRTAQREIPISIKKFSSLTKSKIKEIREFVFKWKKMNYSSLESGTYFKLKDGLKEFVTKSIREIDALNIEINIDTLKEIEEDINQAIYTVAIVGPTKAGKSTIINTLVSKNVSPVNIRPTTGIPTNIVPGREEKTEILLKNGEIITGPADVSFLNQYVAIDQNKGNHKGVKMVTVWIRSTQMEKGLSFCDFPGLDDGDPEIERTVAHALQFVNAIIYVIDASGMPKGFKFPKQYRDDLLSLKNKDRIFLVINKIDDFDDLALLEEFKVFIDDQLEELKLKSLLPSPPIFMVAKKAFEERQKGIYENDAMALLESQVWDHLLANSKSGLHNLMNIIGQVSIECERLTRTLQIRMLNGDKQKELSKVLASTKIELDKIKNFEKGQRQQITRWLFNTLDSEKKYLIAYYKAHLQGIGINNVLPNDTETQTYLLNQFTLTAPLLFEQLENEITGLNNKLNDWVNTRLQSVEITIDQYSQNQFRNSEAFAQLLKPIANIFLNTNKKNVPTIMLGNIIYHIINTIETFGDWLAEIFTNKQVVRDRKVNNIIENLEGCYNEIFEKMYFTFNNHLDSKCSQLLSKVVDRTNIYIVGLNKQIEGLNTPLSEVEKNIYDMACDKLSQLDSQCAGVKLQIEDYTGHLKVKSTENTSEANSDIEEIEKRLRALINEVLTAKTGLTEAKKLIPSHIQPNLENRINKLLRDHPQTDPRKFNSLESQLQFFDMSEYYDIVSNKSYWEHFSSTFNNKENLNKHIIQLGNLRNTIRHSRELTKLILAEGEASILWFQMALKIQNNSIASR